MKRLLAFLFLLSSVGAAQTINNNVYPAQEGLDLGRQGQRWDIFGRNVDISGNLTVNGVLKASPIQLTCSANLAPFFSCAVANGNHITLTGHLTLNGNTTKLATVFGTPVAGNCVKWDASGNIIDNGATCGGGGGGGTPAGSTGTIQYNASGSFGGAVQTTVTAGSGVNPAEVDIANFNNIRYNSGYNFSVSPSGTLSVGANTVTLPGSCPAGLNGTDTAAASKWHYIRIVSAGGDTSPSEPVLITGGTCTGGAASGTITFNAAFSHIATYLMTSATAGLQEMISDAGSPSAKVVILPSHSNLSLYAPVYLNIQRLTLEGGGSRLQCFFNDSCLIMGARTAYGVGNALTYQQQTIKDLMFIGGSDFWSATPNAAVTGGSPSETLTFASCPTAFYPLIPNQLLWLSGSVGGLPISTYGTGEYVTSIGGTCLPGGAGTIIVQQATPGVTNLTAHDATSTLSSGVHPFIEDNAQGSAVYNISFISNTATTLVGHGIQVDNDQKANAYNINANSSNLFRHDADFAGTLFYGPGPLGTNAGLLYVDGFTSSAGGCVDWWNGNDISLMNGVCQAYTQFGMRFNQNRGGGGRTTVGPNVHFELGNGTPPLGMIGIPNIIASAASSGSLQVFPGIGLPASESSTGKAAWPIFLSVAAQTATQYYWVAPHNNALTGCTAGGDCVGIPLPIGVATVNDPSANNVTLKFMALPGTSSYDILRSASASGTLFVGPPAAPNGTGTYLVGTVTVNSSNCDIHAICTFTDNVATGSLSSYTVNLTTKQWYPAIYQWPGSVVIGNSSSTNSAAPLGNYNGPETCITSVLYPNIGSNNKPSAFAFPSPIGVESKHCVAQSQTIYTPYYGGFSSATNSGATLEMSGTAISNSKGRHNYGPQIANIYDILTLCDSNWSKTVSTPQSDGTLSNIYRPTKDSNDCFLGFDGANGAMAEGSPTSLSRYIATSQDGSAWKDRLTSSLYSLKVPLTSTGLGTFAGLSSSLPLDVTAGTYSFQAPEVAAPAAPAAGKQRCYQVAGSGLACIDSASNVYTMTAPGAGTNYQTMQASGVALPVQPIFNCTGAGITCSDDPGNTRTNINVPGGNVGTTGSPATNQVAIFSAAATITGAATDTTTTHAFFATAGVPAFRAIVAGDIPTLNQNTSGTAANVSGTPALPNGTTCTTQAPGTNNGTCASTAFVIANGSGNVTTAGMTNQHLPKASGANSLVDSLLTDNGTNMIYTGTGGLALGGTNPLLATQTASNTDLAGQLTMSGGTIAYSFANTWATAPICVATDITAIAAVRVQTTTTTLTITGTGTDLINYICVGRT